MNILILRLGFLGEVHKAIHFDNSSSQDVTIEILVEMKANIGLLVNCGAYLGYSDRLVSHFAERKEP